MQRLFPLVEEAAFQHDPAHFIEQLAQERAGMPGVVFAHSLDAVENIRKRLEADGHRVVVLTGADSAKDKEAKRRAFNPDAGEASA